MNANSTPQPNEDIIKNLREALQGSFEKIPTWLLNPALEVFVSSTFTDTHKERNILLTEILPKLRDRASKFKIAVTFFDLRTGIPDSNTLDHDTWNGCYRALKQCLQGSRGIFFLSLQSMKYGYMMLPKTIGKDVFEARLKEREKPELKTLAEEWYTLDLNAVNKVYVLRNLTG